MRTTKEPKERPLLALAAQQTAERIAKIRSLTTDITGLSIRKHKKMCEFLEILASESFSDGTITQARVTVLAARMGRSRAQIYRYCNDATELGILSTDRRKGSIDQDISSERTIVWDSIDKLLGLVVDRPPVLEGVSNETPPSQLRRPRLNCDTPVSIETPNSTDSTDRTDKNSKSGSSDFSNRIFERTGKSSTVQVSAIRDRADRLFERLKYSGDEGYTLWRAAAAVHLGIIDEAAVETAASRAGDGGKGVGWFRVVLAEKANMSPETLKEVLMGIRLKPYCPGDRPKRRPPPIRLSLKRPPAARSDADRQAEANRRRNEILDHVAMEN